MSTASMAPGAQEKPRGPDEIPENGRKQAATQPSSSWDRPPGWLGWWSERYARVIARTLGSPLPTNASALADRLATAAPLPFAEALDPVASVAEPRDRNGRLLPWHFERSAAFDLFGFWGTAFGVLTVGLVVLNFAIANSVGQTPTRKGADTPTAKDTNPKMDVPPQQQQQQPLNNQRDRKSPISPLNVEPRTDKGPTAN